MIGMASPRPSAPLPKHWTRNAWAPGCLFRLDLIPVRTRYKQADDAEGDTRGKVVKNNPADEGVWTKKHF